MRGDGYDRGTRGSRARAAGQMKVDIVGKDAQRAAEESHGPIGEAACAATFDLPSPPVQEDHVMPRGATAGEIRHAVRDCGESVNTRSALTSRLAR